MLEKKLEQAHQHSDSDTSSNDSSEDSTDDASLNDCERRVIEVHHSTWNEKRKIELNKVKAIAKRRKHSQK